MLILKALSLASLHGYGILLRGATSCRSIRARSIPRFTGWSTRHDPAGWG